MIKFCMHEMHGGICEKTGTYCNLGACPYEDLKEFTVVQHGQWKPVKYNVHCSCGKSYGTYHYECSACGHVAYAQPYGLKFCPNCGARMDGKAV